MVAEEVVDYERGDEERPQQHVLRLTFATVDAVGLHIAVAAVDRGHGLAGRGHVRESLLVTASGLDDQLVGQGEVPVDAPPYSQIRCVRLDDVAESPDWDSAPRHPVFIRCGEALPVPHGLAVDGVGDVVGGQAEGVDPDTCLASVEGLGRVVDSADVVEVGFVDFEMHRNSSPSWGSQRSARTAW